MHTHLANTHTHPHATHLWQAAAFDFGVYFTWSLNLDFVPCISQVLDFAVKYTHTHTRTPVHNCKHSKLAHSPSLFLLLPLSSSPFSGPLCAAFIWHVSWPHGFPSLCFLHATHTQIHIRTHTHTWHSFHRLSQTTLPVLNNVDMSARWRCS